MPSWWQNRQNRQNTGYFGEYLENPGYTRVIPALLHGFAPGTTPTAATTAENPAYHFRIPLYHTTPTLIKISPNTGLIPVKFEHCSALYRSQESARRVRCGASVPALVLYRDHTPNSPRPPVLPSAASFLAEQVAGSTSSDSSRLASRCTAVAPT